METGISYEDVRSAIGMVPEFEEREAAALSGYRWADWMNADPEERAAAVAHSRLRTLIGLHSHDAIERYQKAQATAARARGGGGDE